MLPTHESRSTTYNYTVRVAKTQSLELGNSKTANTVPVRLAYTDYSRSCFDCFIKINISVSIILTYSTYIKFSVRQFNALNNQYSQWRSDKGADGAVAPSGFLSVVKNYIV